MKRTLFIAASIVALLITAAGETDQNRIYRHPYNWQYPETVSPSSDDLVFPDPQSRYFCSKCFYYTGLLSSGYIYILHLFHWKYGILDGWGLTTLVTDFEGNYYLYEGKIKDNDLTESREPFSIRFPNGRIDSNGNESNIYLKLDGLLLELQLVNILPPWKPGDGYAYLSEGDDIYMRKAVPSPLARTQGSLIMGDKRFAVSGLCYGDRSLTVMPLKKSSFTSYAFRTFSEPEQDEEPWVLALLHYIPADKKVGFEIPMLLLARGDRWMLTTKDYRITPGMFAFNPETPYPYPMRIHLSARGEENALEGDFICSKLVYTSDVFRKLPPLFRAVLSFFVKRPIVFRMAGYFKGVVTGLDGSETRIRLSGQGDYSISR